MKRQYDEIGKVYFTHEEYALVQEHWDELDSFDELAGAQTFLKTLLGRDFTEGEMMVVGLMLEQKRGNVRTLSVIPGGRVDDD